MPATAPRREPAAESSPLWGLVIVLREIAARVARPHAEEHVPLPGLRTPPSQQDGAA